MKLVQIFHQRQNVLFCVEGRKCFVQNVLEFLGLRCYNRKCYDDEYKRWANTRVLVSCTMYISK